MYNGMFNYLLVLTAKGELIKEIPVDSCAI